MEMERKRMKKEHEFWIYSFKNIRITSKEMGVLHFQLQKKKKKKSVKEWIYALSIHIEYIQRPDLELNLVDRNSLWLQEYHKTSLPPSKQSGTAWA